MGRSEKCLTSPLFAYLITYLLPQIKKTQTRKPSKTREEKPGLRSAVLFPCLSNRSVICWRRLRQKTDGSSIKHNAGSRCRASPPQLDRPRSQAREPQFSSGFILAHRLRKTGHPVKSDFNPPGVRCEHQTDAAGARPDANHHRSLWRPTSESTPDSGIFKLAACGTVNIPSLLLLLN